MLVGLYSKIHGVAKIVVKIFINLFIGLGLLTGSGGDVAKQPAEQFFMDGDTAFVRSAAASNRWSVGFSKVIITPEDVLTNAKKYYLAGYGNNTNPTEVMDDLYVRTIYMDDNSGRGGVLFAVIDAIGLTNKDVLDIRGRIHDFAAEKNIKSVNVSCTHVHAGIDTMGLWGNMATLTSGRNKAFNETLKNQVVDTMVQAYDNRRVGSLLWGEIHPEYDLFNDNRAPYMYDKTITRIRFSPEGTKKDASDDIYMVCMNAHPECMAITNTSVSADFPAYMGQYIEKETGGAEFVFINGAIGVLVNSYGLGDIFHVIENKTKLFESNGSMTNLEELKTRFARVFGATARELTACFDSITAQHVDADGNLNPEKKTQLRKVYTIAYGKTVGRYVMSLDKADEYEIAPFINIRFNPITVKVENVLLELAMAIGMISVNSYDTGKKNLDTAITSEVGYLELGNSLRVLLAPGELAPEIAMGGFLPAAQSALNYNMDVKTGFEIVDPNNLSADGKSKNLVFGLMNDEIGYIIPDNDFYVHRFLPYLANDNDRLGVSHYEEGVSTSIYTCRLLLDEWQSIYDSTR